jgi:predicted double-glycine peptidase
MLVVPDVVQSNSWSCGVAVVQAVLQAHGISGYQDDYARELGTTRESGTHPSRIVALLRKHGLGVELREGMNTDDLRRAVDRGDLVILDFQAWREDARGSYETDWEDGHYAILIGYEGDRLLVEDPSILGAVGWLAEKELLDRWRDYELERGRRREYVRAGIVVRGPVPGAPSARRRFEHVD